MQPTSNYTYRNLFQDFGGYFKPYLYKIIGGSFLRLISAVIALYAAYALSQVVDFLADYQTGDDLLPLYTIICLWTLCFLVRNLFFFYAKMIGIKAGECIGLDIEKDALRHLSLIDISWHERENSGNKVQKIIKGAKGISTLVRIWIVNVIDISVSFVGTFFIISRFDYVLAFIVVSFEIIYYLIAMYYKRNTVKASRVKNIKDEQSIGVMFEIANNIRTVKVLGIAKPLLDYVQRINVELIDLIEKNMLWFHSGVLARNSWQNIGRIGILMYIIYGILHGKYELGFFVLVYAYVNTLSQAIEDLSNASQDILLAKTDTERLAGILAQKIIIEDETGKVDFPKNWDMLHIKDLSFSYGQNQVLNNISFDVKKGEKVGIVGLSGAGKSTLFKILLKEYEAASENITIGNTPLNKIKKSDYVHHVAVVLQETEVFNLSLRKNISISNDSNAENKESFERSLAVSHVNDFLQKLPEGVETLIGEKGVKLSGGERQRLGIARAVFKNPEILFLDEATSHLDVESEQKIQDSLAHFFKDVTAVVIAHRLSTIKEMDRIIVLEHGKIIETGTFDELHTQNGRFREFWDKQKL